MQKYKKKLESHPLCCNKQNRKTLTREKKRDTGMQSKKRVPNPIAEIEERHSRPNLELFLRVQMTHSPTRTLPIYSKSVNGLNPFDPYWVAQYSARVFGFMTTVLGSPPTLTQITD